MSVELSTPLPSEDLIFLVNGHRDEHQFALSRIATPENIMALLEEAGEDFRRFTSILDYGCGCGRILAGWEPHLRPGVMLNGVDINHKLISFCKANILFARTEVCGYLPPLPYFIDGQFDFVYVASVFTHLSVDASYAWAREMRRLVRPGGVLMMSFHGSYYDSVVANLSPEGLETLRQTGCYVHLIGEATATWQGANHYATFMSKEFVDGMLKGFDLLKTYPGESRGPNPFASYQDISIFRRRNHDGL